MKPLASAALAAGFFFTAVAPASAATIFTDATAFDAATTNVTVETFDTDIAGPGLFDPDAAITFANGTISTATTNILQFNEVEDGTFRGGTRAGRDDSFDHTITFDFGRDITAFGGDFTGASEIMLTGMFDGMTETFLLGDSLGGADGFFGLTSTTAFRTVTFSTDAGAFVPFGNPTVSIQAINFGLDNLALGDVAPTVAPVPLPASALLLAAGLGAFGALRRSRRRT